MSWEYRQIAVAWPGGADQIPFLLPGFWWTSLFTLEVGAHQKPHEVARAGSSGDHILLLPRGGNSPDTSGGSPGTDAGSSHTQAPTTSAGSSSRSSPYVAESCRLNFASPVADSKDKGKQAEEGGSSVAGPRSKRPLLHDKPSAEGPFTRSSISLKDWEMHKQSATFRGAEAQASRSAQVYKAWETRRKNAAAAAARGLTSEELARKEAARIGRSTKLRQIWRDRRLGTGRLPVKVPRGPDKDPALARKRKSDGQKLLWERRKAENAARALVAMSADRRSQHGSANQESRCAPHNRSAGPLLRRADFSRRGPPCA